LLLLLTMRRTLEPSRARRCRPDQQSGAVGACLLALLAFAWHNLFRRDAWPKQWW
jgi:hypothetical protein